MAERFRTSDPKLTSIRTSIDEVQTLVAGASTSALNKNQCAYLSGKLQVTDRFLHREDVRKRIHDASTDVSLKTNASAALIQLESVVKRAKGLVQQCCQSNVLKGALTLFTVKYDVLDIVIHLQWWSAILSTVIGVSKMKAPERIQCLNKLFEERLEKFSDLEKAAQDDKIQLLDKVKMEIQATDGESLDTAHLVLLQVYALLTGQDEHSYPKLNKYTYDRLLGQGGYGVVLKVKWCGYDCVLKEYNELKVDDVEVKSLKRLHHPHIIKYFRHWKSEKTEKYDSHILMERMERDLEDLIKQKRTKRTEPFSLPVAVNIMLQVISAVWHMHNNNFVHRDLKPGNVLVSENKLLPEGYVEVKLGDFGVAKADMMTSNSEGLTKVGTTYYRAPELSSREYTEGAKTFPRRIDMWSFGIMCSQILTGLSPFSGFFGNAVQKHIENGGRPSLPDDCPGYLRYCIESCWNLDPKKRPRAADMWRMLRIAELRILGLVDDSCDSLFRFEDRSNKQQAYQNAYIGPVHEDFPTTFCAPSYSTQSSTARSEDFPTTFCTPSYSTQSSTARSVSPEATSPTAWGYEFWFGSKAVAPHK